jgi:hypothetical protein
MAARISTSLLPDKPPSSRLPATQKPANQQWMQLETWHVHVSSLLDI